MTYQRASDRQPETLIREWRGTCSGKHYLLQALFAELGIPARLIACTTNLTRTRRKSTRGCAPSWRTAVDGWWTCTTT